MNKKKNEIIETACLHFLKVEPIFFLIDYFLPSPVEAIISRKKPRIIVIVLASTSISGSEWFTRRPEGNQKMWLEGSPNFNSSLLLVLLTSAMLRAKPNQLHLEGKTYCTLHSLLICRLSIWVKILLGGEKKKKKDLQSFNVDKFQYDLLSVISPRQYTKMMEGAITTL